MNKHFILVSHIKIKFCIKILQNGTTQEVYNSFYTSWNSIPIASAHFLINSGFSLVAECTKQKRHETQFF